MARKSAKSTSRKGEASPDTKTAKRAAPARAKATTKAKTKAPKQGPASAGGDGRSLVIVESPKKANSINKFLGSGFVVKASKGHVRDLPKKGKDMGIDVAPATRRPTWSRPRRASSAS